MTVDNSYRHRSCPVCASERIYRAGAIPYLQPVIFSTQEITLAHPPELWRCRGCASGFTQNVIPEKEALSLYSTGVGGERWSREPLAESKGQEILAVLKDLFRPECRVLDVGCNTGELLDFAREKGAITFGVEPCEASRATLAAKGHQAWSTLEQAAGSFDVVTAFDLVEHLYRLPDFLAACREKLAPGGRLVLLTGDISCAAARISGTRWWYLCYPEHIVFPSRGYLRSHPGFKAVAMVSTYASIGYRKPLVSAWKAALRGTIGGHYNGLPSTGPDHVLAVLEKC